MRSPRRARAKSLSPTCPSGGGHWTRTVAFGPDGKLYVAIGSSCNVCIEQDPRRAAISVYDPDGKNGRVFATGLRNAVGITWQPGTNQMWATVNGRDNIGDDIPPDDLRTINDGTFYGWPYCYGGKTPNPEYKDQAAAKCKDTPPNARSLPAHVAPLGLAFGDGLSAPQPYKDSLYIAYHGSWNRSVKVGYKLVRVPFIDGKAGQPEDFATGWLPGGATNPGQVWGRPVGVDGGQRWRALHHGRFHWRDVPYRGDGQLAFLAPVVLNEYIWGKWPVPQGDEGIWQRDHRGCRR